MVLDETLAGNLKVRKYESRLLMGQDAARMVREKIKSLLLDKEVVNMIFASAPSQSEFLDALAKDPEIDWSRVVGFHMDEYIGLDAAASQNFASFLRRNLFDLVPIKKVYFIKGDADNIEEECDRYAQLLIDHPTDIVCMGIGENTHIAFNDPHVADFNDPKLVKIVDLDEKSRQQQVNDGCFPAFGDVPTHAITLTIPALTNGDCLFCMVPGKNKSRAIFQTLNEEISALYPSTILRQHPNSILFIDEDSGSELTLPSV